jgi:hypothetical protein
MIRQVPVTQLYDELTKPYKGKIFDGGNFKDDLTQFTKDIEIDKFLLAKIKDRPARVARPSGLADGGNYPLGKVKITKLKDAMPYNYFLRSKTAYKVLRTLAELNYSQAIPLSCIKKLSKVFQQRSYDSIIKNAPGYIRLIKTTDGEAIQLTERGLLIAEVLRTSRKV